MPLWFLMSLVALTSWGVGQFFRKQGTRFVSPWTLIVFQTGTLMLFASAAVAIKGLDVTPEALALAVAGGVFQFVGNIALLHSLARGPASVIVPFTSMYPVVTLVLGLLLFHESLSTSQFIGILLSIGALYSFSR